MEEKKIRIKRKKAIGYMIKEGEDEDKEYN